MFDRKGIIIINSHGLDEETVMMDALDCGAEDFGVEEGYFEISTEADSMGDVRDAMEAKGYSFESAEVDMIPQTTVTLTDEHDLLMMEKLIDALDDNDDVQDVYHNWDEPEA